MEEADAAWELSEFLTMTNAGTSERLVKTSLSSSLERGSSNILLVNCGNKRLNLEKHYFPSIQTCVQKS